MIQELHGNFDRESGFIFWSNNELWQRQTVLDVNTAMNQISGIQSNDFSLAGSRSTGPMAESGYDESDSPDHDYYNVRNRRNNRSRGSQDMSLDVTPYLA